jgi:hypothetical protein
MIPTKRVTTLSGSVYEFTANEEWVRRTYPASPLRRDGDWIHCRSVGIAVGYPMRMLLLGVADVGMTLRTTTPVVDIAYYADDAPTVVTDVVN